ncbi:unnamed protein product [Ambrosiozyma monospora]|uniref:tRNA (guanine(26)-N(2))-dimethyltransferase n=1 Tax=Ambrosiozyma monospora TaxID=43982 RepID=A0A9W6YZP2_AMBMO|nr:unnamed protein product [Ambrosiozyma monospora]
MLTMAKNELLDSSFYFKPTTISSILKVTAPSIAVFSAALGNLGYSASLTHAMTNCIKTDAPWEIVWYVGKKWSEKNGIDVEKMNKNAVGYHIMTNDKIGEGINLSELKPKDSKLSDLEWLFSPNEVSNKIKHLRSIKIVRYQENPSKNWGPKARPK